jgi:hypothetical protein
VTVALAILGVAASLVLPRLTPPDALALGASARRLADGLRYARDRAILGGSPMRVVLDLDASRWIMGRPGREAAAVEAGAAPLERTVSLPRGVRLRAVTIGSGPAVRAGSIALELSPAGDALPVRIDLADERGRALAVLLPPACGRAAVLDGARG